MNDAIPILLLLFLVSLEAAEPLDEQRTNSIQRLLQRDEDEFDPAATDFLAQVSASTLENDSAEDFTAFIDALAANASATNGNRSSDSNDTFENADSDFTLTWSSSSDDENASISLDQDVGSSFSSSGEIQHDINGDANLAGGENLPSSLSTMDHPRGFLVLLTIGLMVEFATWLHQDGH